MVTSVLPDVILESDLPEINYIILQFRALPPATRHALSLRLLSSEIGSEEFFDAGGDIFDLIDSGDVSGITRYINNVLYYGVPVVHSYVMWDSERPRKIALCSRYFHEHLVPVCDDYEIPDLTYQHRWFKCARSA